MRIRSFIAASAIAISGAAGIAWAAGDAPTPPSVAWSFTGPFGTFDRAQLKRGFKVYAGVCAACHGLRHLYFRNLLSIGIKPSEMKDLMEQREVRKIDDAGDVSRVPSGLNNRIGSPYQNKQAGATANGGKYPPDLTLMVKARGGGADYLYGLMVGYVSSAECAKQFKDNEGKPLKPDDGQHCNKYFPGHIIAMPRPLLDEGQVEYSEKGAPKATVQQMAQDVAAFLAWAAEPEMEQRKRIGIRAMLFLLVLTLLFFVIYKQVWRDVKKK